MFEFVPKAFSLFLFSCVFFHLSLRLIEKYNISYLPVTALNGVSERAAALDEESAERRIVRELIVMTEDRRTGDEE